MCCTVLFMMSPLRTFVTGEIAHILCLTAYLICQGAVHFKPDVRVMPCFRRRHMWTVLGALGDTVMSHFAATTNLMHYKYLECVLESWSTSSHLWNSKLMTYLLVCNIGLYP